MTTLTALITACAFLLAVGLTTAARSVSRRIGFLDRPTGRKAHRRPVPFGGGSAVFAAFAILVLGGLGAAMLLDGSPHAEIFGRAVADHLPGVVRKAPTALGLLATALLIHLMGLWDDARNLRPVIKLAFQLTAAAIVVFGLDIRASFFVPVPWVGAAVSVLWIVLITNSFNFLDNMDGLCAGVAVLCGSALLAAAMLNGEHFIAALLAALLGALAGFLLFNFPPATIFLGDAGSQTIGFLLGTATLLATYYGGRGGPTASDPVSETAARSAVLIPVVALAVPLYDTLSVMLIRLREGRPLWVGDNSHFSHRLRARGLSDRRTVLTVYLCTFATAAGSVFLGRVPFGQALLVFAQTAAVLGILAILESTATKPRE